MLLGSAHIKTARKTLMKLTPGGPRNSKSFFICHFAYSRFKKVQQTSVFAVFPLLILYLLDAIIHKNHLKVVFLSHTVLPHY